MHQRHPPRKRSLDHPDAAPDAIEAILRRLPLKFQWEEDTGMYEVTYPDKMRQQAAKEWRVRFPFRHLTWTKVEEAIDADPELAEFSRVPPAK